MMSNDRSTLLHRSQVVALICVLLTVLFVGGLVGYRINLTPSEPLGLWRIEALDRPVVVSDRVFICPPRTDSMRLARTRGYLRGGLCPGDYAPLIKTVAAISGQRVVVGRDVSIDGATLDHSVLSAKDGRGRALVPFDGGVVPSGDIFLHSDFIGSYDSRYFGPIPASGILGLAEEVWTYAP